MVFWAGASRHRDVDDRPRDVGTGTVISEYVDVAHAFYDKRESGFVNGLLDAVAKDARK